MTQSREGSVPPDQRCEWPSLEAFRSFHPDYTDLSDDELAAVRSVICEVVETVLDDYLQAI